MEFSSLWRGTCSFRAGVTGGCWWPGLCQAGLHIVHGIKTWCLCLSVTAITGSRVMHSVPVYENTLFWVTLWFIFVDMNFWKPSLSFPFSALLGGSGFHTAPSNGLSVNPELPFSPILLNLFHLHPLPAQCAWAAGEGWGRVLPVPLNKRRRELPQMWAVPGVFVAGCKCHPWSLGSACWLHPRWPLQKGEKLSSAGTACSCCKQRGDIFKLPLECFGWHREWKELPGSHPFL